MRTRKRNNRKVLRPRFIVLIAFSMVFFTTAMVPKVTETAVSITERPVPVTKIVDLVTEFPEKVTEATAQSEKDELVLYDIPLDEELQAYTFEACKESNVSYLMVLAMMERESDFREKIISKTNDYGIMQINKVNHSWLEDKLGIDDFLDAKQNISAGVYMLAALTEKYEDTNRVLMAYNRGENGAKKLWDKGIYSTEYSRNIQQAMDGMAVKGGSNEKMD